MKDKINAIIRRNADRKERNEHYGNIAKKAKEAFKNFTPGDAGGDESVWILGFMAGYLKKEKEISTTKPHQP